MSDSAAIHVQHVTHRYGGTGEEGTTALRDLSLTVPGGVSFALLGPNGSGKTTLFRILSTLLRPTEGTAQVFGCSTSEAPAAVRQMLGVAFQEPALDEALTVEENLRCHGALFGLRGEALTQAVTDRLERLGVADRRADRVSTLSGGLRRRADLARALLHDPRLLLLDEPTGGLDPAARRAFWQYLARLQESGTTLLVATHLMDEAERADRVAILHEGQAVAADTPAALKDALGERTLIVESADLDALAQRIQAQFGLDVRRAGDALHLDHEDAPALLSRLYDAFPDRIESATVRRPTLEDVFMARTGASGALPSAAPSSLQAH